MKYLIVDTYNGDGYTDSKHQVKEFESIEKCREHCISLAKEYAGNEFVVDDGEGVTYTTDYISSFDEVDDAEDHGCVHYQQLNGGEIAVCINPLVNDYWVLHTEAEVDEVIEMIREYSDEYANLPFSLEYSSYFGSYHHHALEGDGDIKMERIEPSPEVLTMAIQGTQAQFDNLMALMDTFVGDNDLPLVIKLSAFSRVVIESDVECYKCKTVQESTQRFCVECGTCLS